MEGEGEGTRGWVVGKGEGQWGEGRGERDWGGVGWVKGEGQ